MAQTNLIKFCGFIVYSKHKNMTLSAFHGKIHETEKNTFFNFSVTIASPNVAPNPTDQSHSNSISRVPLQISPFRSFLILVLLLKLRVVNIKKIKNLIFSKMAPMILINFCRFIVHSKPNNVILLIFPGKIPELEFL